MIGLMKNFITFIALALALSGDAHRPKVSTVETHGIAISCGE